MFLSIFFFLPTNKSLNRRIFKNLTFKVQVLKLSDFVTTKKVTDIFLRKGLTKGQWLVLLWEIVRLHSLVILCSLKVLFTTIDKQKRDNKIINIIVNYCTRISTHLPFHLLLVLWKYRLIRVGDTSYLC